MKKTLSVLLAVAAASAVYAQDASNEVVFSQSWTAGGPADTNTTIQAASKFGYTLGNDYAIIGQNNHPWAAVTTTSSFTISFDLKNVNVTAEASNWKDIFSFQLQDDTKLQLQMSTKSSDPLHLYSTGTSTEIQDLDFTLNDLSTWKTLTIVGDATAGKISFYVDTTLVGESSGEWAGSGLERIHFAAEVDTETPDRVPSGTMQINNISITNGVILPTPEPTTATLSLLALAGLCARRRRK